MIGRHLITNDILPLKTSDSGTKALNWMDEYKLTHLPIVNNETLLGVISEQDIYDFNNTEEALGSHSLSLVKAFVNEHQHLYDVLKLMHRHALTLIPVLDDNDKYLGCITLRKLLAYIANTFSVDNPGGIIVVELSEKDYNLTEIANIVESNDAKILSTFLTNHHDSTRLELVIKVNKIDIGAILQTFDRYGYIIKASFEEDKDQEEMRERYDSLMNYINI